MTFERLGRVRLARGAIVDFDEDHLIAPDGRPMRRDVIRHRGGVAVLPVMERRIWLVRQFRNAYDCELWEIPAGRLEAGEQPVETARRELVEELGALADTLEPLAVVYPSPGYTAEVIHVFVAEGIVPGKRTPDGAEERFGVVRSWELGELLEMIDEGRLPDAKTQIAVLAWARRSGM